MVKVSFGRPCHVPPCLINEEGGSSNLEFFRPPPHTLGKKWSLLWLFENAHRNILHPKYIYTKKN